MEVRQLIQALRRCPPDAHVVFVHPAVTLTQVTHNPELVPPLTVANRDAIPVNVETVNQLEYEDETYVALSDDIRKIRLTD